MLGLAVKEEEESPGGQGQEQHQGGELVSAGGLLEEGLEGRNMGTRSCYDAKLYENCINVFLSLIPQLAIIVSLVPGISP